MPRIAIRRMACLLGFSALALSQAADARGAAGLGFVPVSQSRTTFAEIAGCQFNGRYYDCFDQADGESAEDDGPFTSSVSVGVEVWCTGSASASQTSAITGDRIEAQGEREAISGSTNFGCWTGEAVAESSCSFTFEVSVPTPYRLRGFVAGSLGQSSFTLTGPGTSVAHATTSAMPFAVIDETGVLQPGTHVFSAIATGAVEFEGPVSRRSAFDLVMTVEPPTPVVAPAGVIPIAQSRSVEWTEHFSSYWCEKPDPPPNCGQHSASSFATGFEPFAVTIESATQDSIIEESKFVAFGRATPSVSALVKAGENNWESSSSNFSATFEVLRPVRAELRLVIANAAVVSMPPFLAATTAGAGFVNVDDTFELPPGTYTLGAVASKTLVLDRLTYNSASYDEWFFARIRFLTLPDPADLNGDGSVDGADLGLLLLDWGPCAPGVPCAADLNGDGVVDGEDLGVLLTAWTS